MDVAELSRLTIAAETHRRVVGDYEGQYALGVSEFPLRLVLRVAASDTSRFPRRVVLNGQSVAIEVTGGLAEVIPTARVR